MHTSASSPLREDYIANSSSRAVPDYQCRHSSGADPISLLRMAAGARYVPCRLSNPHVTDSLFVDIFVVLLETREQSCSLSTRITFTLGLLA